MMVINSTNINKMNNHLSSELNLLNTKKTTTYDVGNPGPDLGQAQHVAGLNLLRGSQPSTVLLTVKMQYTNIIVVILFFICITTVSHVE
jgi:hypothetical protein